MAETRTKKLSAEEESALLEKIRAGDIELIDKLVYRQEDVILSIIQQSSLWNKGSIKEITELAKNALRKLAKSEVGSKGRESFFDLKVGS